MIFKLLRFIGKINTSIILTFIWFAILLPISIFRKISSKDFQKFTWNLKSKSNWQETKKLYTKEDLDHEW